MNYKKEDVILAMKNNKEAFSRLYEDIYMDLYKMALYITGNRQQAEDIVGDTVLDAYKGIKNLKTPERFEHWILKILTTKSKKLFQKKYSSFTVFNPDSLQSDDMVLISPKNLESEELRTDILNAMSKLKDKDRTIISLCIVQGYTSYEAAEILSMNAATVRSRLNRSLARLRKDLEEKQDE